MLSTLTFALLAATALPLADTTAPANRPQPAAPAQTAPASVAARPATPGPLASAAPLPVTASAAPQTVQLRGVVRYPDGRPCAGASVYPAGSMRQLVITDAQGAFTMPVAVGSGLVLKVEYFSIGSSRVEVPTPSATPLTITLGQ